MAFLPYMRQGERYILAGSEKGEVGIWDWKGNNCREVLNLSECVMTLAFDAVKLKGAAAGPGSAITIFQVAKSAITSLRTIKLPSDGVSTYALLRA